MPNEKRRYDVSKYYTIDDIRHHYSGEYSRNDPIYRAIRNNDIEIVGEDTKPREWLVNKSQFEYYVATKHANQFNKQITFPDFHLKDWTDYWTFKGDYAITADWHLPFYSRFMSDKFIEICELFGMKQHIIVGDVFDQLVYSRYINYDKMAWVEEKGYVREVMFILLDYFDKNHIVMGNHDNRRFKALLGRDDPFGVFEEVCLKEASGEWLSYYNHCFLESGNRKWFLLHPDSAGTTNAWLKTQKAKYPDCNIIGAHSHKFMNDQDPSSNYQMIALPGMQDQKKIGWVMRRAGNDWHWTTGFAIIRNGYCYIFTEKFTDWSLWKQVRIDDIKEEEYLEDNNSKKFSKIKKSIKKKQKK